MLHWNCHGTTRPQSYGFLCVFNFFGVPKREELSRTWFRPGIEKKIPSTHVSSLSFLKARWFNTFSDSVRRPRAISHWHICVSPCIPLCCFPRQKKKKTPQSKFFGFFEAWLLTRESLVVPGEASGTENDGPQAATALTRRLLSSSSCCFPQQRKEKQSPNRPHCVTHLQHRQEKKKKTTWLSL